MRHLLPSLFVAAAVFSVAPAAVHAAAPYFEYGGVPYANLPTNQLSSIDIALVNRTSVTWSIASGRLPNGVHIINNGSTVGRAMAMIRGTATEEGTFPVRILAISDSMPYFLDYTINTYNNAITVQPLGIAQGRVGLPYLQPLSVGDTTTSITSPTWSVTGGTIPPGLSVHATTGAIQGTPTVPGTYQYVVEMREGGGYARAASREYIHVIQPATTVPVQITTRSNPVTGQVGVSYSPQIYQAIGGSGTYQWSVVFGALPPGLTFNPTTGILQGTPTLAGTYETGIKVRDASNEANVDSLTFTTTILPASAPTPPPPTTPSPTTLTLTSTSVPSAVVGTSYTATLAASGGVTPYNWNFASGTLPPGLTLSANGTISGTPTTAGTFSAHIEVFDALGGLADGRTFTFTVTSGSATGPSTPVVPLQPINSPLPSAELSTRLQNLSRIGVSVHALVKLPDDGNALTQEDSAVYYIGTDGRRHAFPNARVFSSWYANFNDVRVLSQANLATIPLGANVTYKPGTRMVKFTTDPKVYAVSGNRLLRWVKTEAAAIALYGSTWNRQIDDIADTFYTDYRFGAEINSASDFDRAAIQTTYPYISDTLAF